MQIRLDEHQPIAKGKPQRQTKAVHRREEPYQMKYRETRRTEKLKPVTAFS